MNLLELNNVSHVYGDIVKSKGLDNLSLTTQKGEFVAIMGPSGSGKSTLLNIISGILPATSGSVIVAGRNIANLNDEEAALFRRNTLGFVFQDFNLVETLTVRENIMLPLMFKNEGIKSMKEKSEKVAKSLGILHILNKRTQEISGGQAQRTAIARAIVHQPELLLADEPTGNLDSANSEEVMKIFENLNRNYGMSTFLVTHDVETATYSQRVIFIKDGKIYNEIRKGNNLIEYRENILNVLSVIRGV
ncbi:ABC transporter ATP-binding protein [Peptoniphilus genitalis]|uniref:ABC transporter ATP-binding protein n=1 Tax=Peptoniphilus genitalis TaxID=3036303 RepID=A0ABY4TTQ2_9FIRM|nr:ABC transporter ATP-binding protein [Peptoniphilus sp. SAHP1]URN41761.1 ABC transporter ATP-binding protein [Peptoniphilus sp. SAHP1]